MQLQGAKPRFRSFSTYKADLRIVKRRVADPARAEENHQDVFTALVKAATIRGARKLSNLLYRIAMNASFGVWQLRMNRSAIPGGDPTGAAVACARED